jgi:prepilin-type N-terminal cleavage/methylation domain-containing protein
MSRQSAIRPRQRGFTLIELLVAIVLMAIMSALSYGAYRNANVQSEALESTAARTRELQVGVAAMVMDLQQLVPRPARETIGDGYRPALRSGAAGQVLELTRGGYPNGEGYFSQNLHAPLPVRLRNDGTPAEVPVYLWNPLPAPVSATLRLIFFNHLPTDRLAVALNGYVLTPAHTDGAWKDPEIHSPAPQPPSLGSTASAAIAVVGR